MESSEQNWKTFKILISLNCIAICKVLYLRYIGINLYASEVG